jgi:hypothetical protein
MPKIRIKIMSIFRRIIVLLGILLLVLIVVLASMSLALGFAVGVGWLLTLILPFTLFEASLLGLIASVIVGTFWYNFLSSTVPGFGPGGEAYDYDDYDDEDDYNQIPASRFYQTEADKTWEAWFRYQIANGIYIEFQDSPQPVAPMGDKQLQELAIRLADLTITLLKAKSKRAKELKITIAALKRQMNKMGQRPYDDNILKLAVAAINEELNYNYEDLIAVIHSKLWAETYNDAFDWEF